MKIKLFVIIVVLLYAITNINAGDKPKAVVQEVSDSLVKIIVDHKDDSDFAVRDGKISKIFLKSFDLVKMSGMTLGRTIWKEKLSAEQKQNFVNKYAEFILTFYISKLSQYDNNKIVVKDAVMKSSGKKATVPTTVEFNHANAKVQYSLSNSSKGWRIYDVEVEGVRLTTTYRSQFQTIFNKKGYDNLIAEIDKLINRIKEKAEEEVKKE